MCSTSVVYVVGGDHRSGCAAILTEDDAAGPRGFEITCVVEAELSNHCRSSADVDKFAAAPLAAERRHR